MKIKGKFIKLYRKIGWEGRIGWKNEKIDKYLKRFINIDKKWSEGWILYCLDEFRYQRIKICTISYIINDFM